MEITLEEVEGCTQVAHNEWQCIWLLSTHIFPRRKLPSSRVGICPKTNTTMIWAIKFCDAEFCYAVRPSKVWENIIYGSKYWTNPPKPGILICFKISNLYSSVSFMISSCSSNSTESSSQYSIAFGKKNHSHLLSFPFLSFPFLLVGQGDLLFEISNRPCHLVYTWQNILDFLASSTHTWSQLARSEQGHDHIWWWESKYQDNKNNGRQQ